MRNSEYSGRTGKPEQVMQNYEDRLPYFILYPFTKTHEWHALDAESRRSIMGQHIKVGIGHPDIRQCLLYSYGVDDQEFIVSYETKTIGRIPGPRHQDAADARQEIYAHRHADIHVPL